MTISTTDCGGARVLSCSGKLTIGEPEDALVAACDEALASGCRWIVLDFLGLAWMDSAGVGAVVTCSKHAAERGAAVKVALRGDGPVRRIFEAVHLDQVFEIFADVQAAAASFPR